MKKYKYHSQKWIKKLRKKMKGNKFALGYRFTKEQKEKVSKAISGKNNGFYGKHHTEETKQKIREKTSGKNSIHFGKKLSKKRRLMISKVHKGKFVSKETRLKLRIANIGRKHTEATKRKIRNACRGKNSPHYGKHPSKETRLKMSKYRKAHPINLCGEKNGMYGKHHTKKARLQMSKERKLRWKDKEYRDMNVKALMLGTQARPNKPETKTNNILNALGFKNFQYTGDGKAIIGGFNPDFLNKTDKQIIEVYGTYWHNKPDYIARDKRRKRTYKNLGYSFLPIWEHELKNEEKVKSKINDFISSNSTTTKHKLKGV